MQSLSAKSAGTVGAPICFTLLREKTLIDGLDPDLSQTRVSLLAQAAL
jgi:hypothetical protein